jgi:pimeloyl-[acyl-carrier protein] methyl ester esterase
MNNGLNVSVHGEGKPLVLLHGWGFDHHVWYPLLPYLVQQYQIYLVDLPGFGLSPPRLWGDFKEDLTQRLPAKFALLGWSLGGFFASRFALEHPQQVTHLINVGSSPRFLRDGTWPGMDHHVLALFLQKLIVDPRGTVKDFIELQLQGEKIEFSLENPPSLIGLQAGLEILANWDLREHLKGATFPVCYMFGRLDAIIQAQTLAVMKPMYPAFDYVMFPKAAHVPFLSHSKAFLEELDRFLK